MKHPLRTLLLAVCCGLAAACTQRQERPKLMSYNIRNGIGIDNIQDIGRIANLARLELNPSESERMLTQLNGFFDIVEKMRAVDTSGLTPLAHPVATIQDVALRLREDVASEPNQREANQKSAPAVERGLFLVPKVIE